MTRLIKGLLTVALVGGGMPAAAMALTQAGAVAGGDDQLCKTVVSAEVGAKPYKLCMTRTQWKARKTAEAKDPNRMVCHYQEQPGTRFRSYKVCLPASEWDNQRLRDRQAIEQIQMRSCVPGAGC
jgi:hypothetical protein